MINKFNTQTKFIQFCFLLHLWNCNFLTQHGISKTHTHQHTACSRTHTHEQNYCMLFLYIFDLHGSNEFCILYKYKQHIGFRSYFSCCCFCCFFVLFFICTKNNHTHIHTRTSTRTRTQRALNKKIKRNPFDVVLIVK